MLVSTCPLPSPALLALSVAVLAAFTQKVSVWQIELGERISQRAKPHYKKILLNAIDSVKERPRTDWRQSSKSRAYHRLEHGSPVLPRLHADFVALYVFFNGHLGERGAGSFFKHSLFFTICNDLLWMTLALV